MSDVSMLRIGLVVAGVLLLAAIYFFGRPRRAGQGRRRGEGMASGGDGRRIEPTLGELLQQELQAGGEGAGGDAVQREIELGDAAPAETAAASGRTGSALPRG